jgi:hypothetical protein
MKTNIEKYIDNRTITNDGCGYIYKDEKAFNNDPSAICYISESQFDDLCEMKKEGRDMTDEELLNQGYAYSRTKLRNEVYIYMTDFRKDVSYVDVAAYDLDRILFNHLEWQNPYTWLSDSEIDTIIPTPQKPSDDELKEEKVLTMLRWLKYNGVIEGWNEDELHSLLG